MNETLWQEILNFAENSTNSFQSEINKREAKIVAFSSFGLEKVSSSSR